MRHLTTLFTASLLLACSATPPPVPSGPTPPAPEEADPTGRPDPIIRPTPTEPTVVPSIKHGAGDPSAPSTFPAFAKVSDEQLDELVASQNAFASVLYQRLAQGDGNVAMSPTSISMAFGMVYAGARSNTASQMARVFQYDLPQTEIHAAFGTVLRSLTEGQRSYDLAVANRLFGEKTRPFEPGFQAVTSDHYNAPLELLSFKTTPDRSRVRINAWIAKQTKDNIKNLLPLGSIKKNTALVLTNAVFFKGKWSQEFKENRTVVDTFTGPMGAVKTKMMRLSGEHQFAHRDGVKLLQMNYKGNDLAMQLVLPDDDDGLRKLESKLANGALDTLIAARKTHAVEVTLPRFTIDPAKPIALSTHLKRMGMVDAWDRSDANLSNMAKLKPKENLCLQEAFHKAFVEVNEEGTKAAAATAIVVGLTTTSAAPTPPRAVFDADHPFLFVIRDLKTNAILFMGRVNDPTKKG